MCGPLGGPLQELQYAGDARVTFDFYFPGVLPGTPFSVPPGTSLSLRSGWTQPAVPQRRCCAGGRPSATLQWATAARLPFNNTTELTNSALYVIGFVLRFTNDSSTG